MANCTWDNSDADGLFSTAANWTPSKPGSSDTAIFDGATTSDTCRLDEALDVLGLVIESDYTGDVDGATDDLNHAVGTGGVTHDGTGDFKLGDGTWTVNGKYDTFGKTNTPGTGLLKLTGTASGAGALRTGTRLNDVEVSGDYDDYRLYCKSLTLKNGSSLVLSYLASVQPDTPTSDTILTIEPGATVGDGTGSLVSYSGSASIGAAVNFGTYSFQNVNYVGTCTLTLTANVTFQGNVTFYTYGATRVMAFSPCNYDCAFEGDLSIQSGVLYLTWNNGTGTLTFQGSANQSIDLFGKAVEDIVVDKTSVTDVVTFAGGWTSDSFTVAKGTVGLNAQTVETVGNFAIGADGQIVAGDDAMDDVDITVGGDFTLTGTNGDEINWRAGVDHACTLDVTGTATATYCDVSYCDASAGDDVDGSGTCIDSGNNTNWINFAGGAPAVHRKKPIIGGGIIG